MANEAPVDPRALYPEIQWAFDKIFGKGRRPVTPEERAILKKELPDFPNNARGRFERARQTGALLRAIRRGGGPGAVPPIPKGPPTRPSTPPEVYDVNPELPPLARPDYGSYGDQDLEEMAPPVWDNPNASNLIDERTPSGVNIWERVFSVLGKPIPLPKGPPRRRAPQRTKPPPRPPRRPSVPRPPRPPPDVPIRIPRTPLPNILEVIRRTLEEGRRGISEVLRRQLEKQRKGPTRRGTGRSPPTPPNPTPRADPPRMPTPADIAEITVKARKIQPVGSPRPNDRRLPQPQVLPRIESPPIRAPRPVQLPRTATLPGLNPLALSPLALSLLPSSSTRTTRPAKPPGQPAEHPGVVETLNLGPVAQECHERVVTECRKRKTFKGKKRPKKICLDLATAKRVVKKAALTEIRAGLR